MMNLSALLVSLLAATALTAGCGARTAGGANAAPSLFGVADVTPAAGGMNAPRSGHTATLLPDGRVLIAGGMERNGVFYDSAELYDPSAGRFRAARGRMSTPRVGHTATLLADGRVLIAGGWGDGGVLASAELYDPATDAFTPTGGMANARGDFTATLLRSGKVLVAGGESDHALSGAEVYDPATGKFTPTGGMSAGRTMHTAVLLPDGRVLVAGGGEYQHPLASAELYDPAAGTFSPTGGMSVPRYKQAATLLPDGNVLVVGGSDGRDWRGRYASAEVYNPSKGVFTSAGEMHAARFKLPEAVALLKNGKVLIAGGGEQIEIYDPATRSFSVAAGRMDAARFYSTATRLADGRVLIAGGYDDHSVASARAWVYKA